MPSRQVGVTVASTPLKGYRKYKNRREGGREGRGRLYGQLEAVGVREILCAQTVLPSVSDNTGHQPSGGNAYGYR